MRSIRLSLIVYFLVLLALALGAVSAVVYQTTEQGLHAKEERTRNLLKYRYDKSRQAENDKLDQAILAKAKNLANFRQPSGRNRPIDFRHWSPEFQSVDLVTGALRPAGHLRVVARLLERPPRPINVTNEPDHLQLVLGQLSAAQAPANSLLTHFWNSAVTFKVRFSPELLPAGDQVHEKDYCQITSLSGLDVQRSESLGDDHLPPAPVGSSVAKAEWVFDDVRFKSDANLRRVTYRAQIPENIVGWLRWRLMQRFPGPSRRGFNPPRHWWSPNPPPGFIIEYARDTHERDANLAKIQTEYDEDLASLEKDTQETLAGLLQRLWWISLATFAAIVVGGLWLIRLGLYPLQRLSEAVSQVSQKDFRLPLNDSRMPSELQPIVHRLSETLEMLKRAFDREKQAAADISHELRTPLAALLTTTEVALRKPRSPEEYRELLNDCRESGKQMSQLVERLLALARLDAGADTLRPREVDVASLAEQCAALVRPLAEARGLRLRVHQQGPARLVADPDKLREVLTNLLHNAIEYNRPDGSIDLTVERSNGQLRVEVRDTGIGIAETAREHIFERFFRADPSRQAEGLHAGLGLSIVKGYVDLMGGTIGVDSAEGEGSTFHIRLPVPPEVHPGFITDRSLTGSPA
jgi:heavy metal sensor kinase